MSEYSKAIGGALSGIVVAVFAWMVVEIQAWSQLPDGLQALALLIPAGVLGGCGPLIAPRNRYRDDWR